MGVFWAVLTPFENPLVLAPGHPKSWFPVCPVHKTTIFELSSQALARISFSSKKSRLPSRKQQNPKKQSRGAPKSHFRHVRGVGKCDIWKLWPKLGACANFEGNGAALWEGMHSNRILLAKRFCFFRKNTFRYGSDSGIQGAKYFWIGFFHGTEEIFQI